MEKRFITSGVAARISVWLQNLMWHMRDTMQAKPRDYLQVFNLTRSGIMQTIIHTQEQPNYRKVLVVPAVNAATEKVYIIEESDHLELITNWQLTFTTSNRERKALTVLQMNNHDRTSTCGQDETSR